MKYQKTLLSVLLATSFSGASSFAQTAPAAEAAAPVSTMAYNLGVVSDYRYRGISQSGNKPALQFGADYTDKSGMYVGTWNSSITWIRDTPDHTLTTVTAKGPLETDIYGGYRGSITSDLTFDVGALQYLYLNNNLASVPNYANPNTTEIYGQLLYGAAYAKLSDSTSNLFGTPNTKGSTYVDLGYTFDFGDGLTSGLHFGNQTIKSNSLSSQVTAYNDYSVALNKDFDGLVVSGTVLGTDYSSRGTRMNNTLYGTGTKNLAGASFILGIKKNF
jgi:uncharacterized protein (TIGR02001 family)